MHKYVVQNLTMFPLLIAIDLTAVLAMINVENCSALFREIYECQEGKLDGTVSLI